MGDGLAGRGSGWRVIAASTTGSRHLAEAQGCQDVHGYWQSKEGLVLVAADGAGSAALAADGAGQVVKTAQREAMLLLGEGGLQDGQAFQAGLLRIVQSARATLDQRVGISAGLADFATTLTVVVVWPPVLGVVQVGDGIVVARRENGHLDLLVGPEGREYVNETTFITSDAFLDEAQLYLGSTENVLGIAVMTDGLQLLALELASSTPYAPFFEPLFAFAASDRASDEELGAFLKSDRVCARTDDDKTLILAARPQPTGEVVA